MANSTSICSQQYFYLCPTVLLSVVGRTEVMKAVFPGTDQSAVLTMQHGQPVDCSPVTTHTLLLLPLKKGSGDWPLFSYNNSHITTYMLLVSITCCLYPLHVACIHYMLLVFMNTEMKADCDQQLFKHNNMHVACIHYKLLVFIKT